VNGRPSNGTLQGSTGSGSGCSFMALDFGRALGLLDDAIPELVVMVLDYSRKNGMWGLVKVFLAKGGEGVYATQEKRGEEVEGWGVS
jgi:hypothetical protein